MRRLSLIAFSLTMLAFGLWLVMAIPTVQAKSDTGYLGMGEWRPTISEPDDVC